MILRKLGRQAGRRKSAVPQYCNRAFCQRRIETTEVKAKEVRALAEK